MKIEFICQKTGLHAYVNREHCMAAILVRDRDRETAYQCRHCGWWHRGPRETCPTTGKRGYLSQRACETDIERAWTDPTWRGEKHGRMPRRAYQCPHCDLWHMSTSSRTLDELSSAGHVDPDLCSPDGCATMVVSVRERGDQK